MTWQKLAGPAPVGSYVRPSNEGRELESRYAEPTPIAHLQGECYLTTSGPTSCWPWEVWMGEGPPLDLDEVRVGRPRRFPASKSDLSWTPDGTTKLFYQYECAYVLRGEWWECLVTEEDHHP